MVDRANFQVNPKIVLLNLEDVKLPERKLRRHPLGKAKKLDRSIAETGHFGPIVVDENGLVIDGVARIDAAKRLSMPQLPAIVVTGLTGAQTKALRMSLNRLVEDASWDVDSISLELDEIRIEGGDLELSGFDDIEIDRFLTPKDTARFDDVEPPPLGEVAVAQEGDIWLCGDHRIICGDATRPETYDRLLGQDKATMVITDPPYNLSIAKGISGRGENRHADFLMASGEMDETQFQKFLQDAMSASADRCGDGSLHYWFMDWRHIDQLVGVGRMVFAELINICVWAKSNWGMGDFYRSQHEMVAVFKKGGGKAINNVQRGKHGRGRSNLWQYGGETAFSKTRSSDLKSHPTVKPVQMVADAIQDASLPGAIVLDPFGGSGTTMLAAEMTQRQAALIELDPKYVDLTLRRYQLATKKKATLLSGGRSFDEVAKDRLKTALDWPSASSKRGVATVSVELPIATVKW
jgi:DNA modification methylase